MYIVKKVDQSPFNQDELGKNAFIICDKITGEAIAEIGSDIPWYVKEGDEVSEEDVDFDIINKSSKHLVVGDKVVFGGLEGEVEKIDLIDKDCYDWNDVIHLKNCKLTLRKDLHFLVDTKTSDKWTITRGESHHKTYLLCKFKTSEDKKWDKLKEEWIELTRGGYNPCYKEMMSFWKERVTIK